MPFTNAKDDEPYESRVPRVMNWDDLLYELYVLARAEAGRAATDPSEALPKPHLVGGSKP
jgi:hypothetical protein